MVTLAFFMTFTALVLLAGTIDAYLFKISFMEAFSYLLRLQVGTRKWMVVAGLVIGLLSCFVIDFRLAKQKKLKKLGGSSG
ncbi:hypothetical protein EJF36_03025 [Bacillus sp. HMF5848]|uniref:hypothetical protein n=1 Tax=Bacillus sp. HMF5848 TaxID=2495421 RepID=UPI000F789B1D|nr:hypothetical protein [Bacillus sp. HMF5848]RSK25949.1 hypothetical protein EJF36_03025 [Bacillus sp. HMF5848]